MSFQPAGLISNMGGIVGVYLSFGFLVVYEILEILFRATYVAIDFKVCSLNPVVWADHVDLEPCSRYFLSSRLSADGYETSPANITT